MGGNSGCCSCFSAFGIKMGASSRASASLLSGSPEKSEPVPTLSEQCDQVNKELGLGGPNGKSEVLVLVGMRAAGKTTLGKVAAKAMNFEFLDMDDLLEKDVGTTINAFVEKHGWPAFREREANLLERVIKNGEFRSGHCGSVIATGGGVVETPSAHELLTSFTPVIWIDRHIEDILKTLEGVGSYRPGLGSPARDIHARRVPLYDKCSDYVFTIRENDENWAAVERRFGTFAAAACSETFGWKQGSHLSNPVCVPIVANELFKACDDIKEAAIQGAGLVELRVDKLKGGTEAVEEALPTLLKLCRSRGLPAIVTFRPIWEDPNAGYAGDDVPRLKALQKAALLGAAFIDVEAKSAATFATLGGMPEGVQTKLILSTHNFNEVLSLHDLRTTVKKIRLDDSVTVGLGPQDVIVKVAQMASSSEEAARMLCILAEAEGPTVALAMGEAGVFTRILAPRFGAVFTFGCLSGRASAPGQPTSEELLESFRLGKLTRKTKVFGLIGDPVVGSPLTSLLNAGFAAANYDAVLVPLLVRGCTLAEFLKVLPQRQLAAALLLPSHAPQAAQVVGVSAPDIQNVLRGRDDGGYDGEYLETLDAAAAVPNLNQQALVCYECLTKQTAPPEVKQLFPTR